MKWKQACKESSKGLAKREDKVHTYIKNSSGACTKIHRGTKEETRPKKREHLMYYDWTPINED